MTKKFSYADYVKHTNRITEGELWELVKTGRDNINNIGIIDGVMDRDSTKYYSNEITKFMEGGNSNDWILVYKIQD